MHVASLTVVDAGKAPVWRVGRAPDPWAWTDHQYAGHNRWDDADGVFPTVYAGDSLYACYVEVLAFARPDITADGKDLLDEIAEDPEDATAYPVPPAAVIPREWIGARMVGEAELSGPYVDVRSAETISTLRPRFLATALTLGYPDFDAAALKSASPRELTQRISTYLYALTDDDGTTIVDGVRFASRHGDELTMWAVFERPGDEPISTHLRYISTRLVDLQDPDLTRAMSLHRLRLQ